MAEESEEYLAVLKASYDYEPQSDEEIAIKEDQLLFLLERTDEDWWKVKVKGETQEEESPAGLVPAAYVEQADHTNTVKALYDYEANAPGELTVKEDEVLLVFGQEDAWLVVQSQAEGGKAGFVPENYCEPVSGDGEEEQPTAVHQIIVPPSPPPPPVSTYVDPADRVASAKATADDIKTWSVSEVDKKGKKKKGTLGVGNGAIFFASDSDKTPVQKWQVADINDTNIEKGKHVHIEVGGAAPISLHYHAGSKDTAEAIITKLESSKALTAPRPSVSSPTEEAHSPPSAIRTDLHKSTKNGASVRFAPTSPTVIPPRSPSEEDYAEAEADPEPEVEVEPEPEPEEEEEAPVHHGDDEETAKAMYDFDADGEDELSVKEGEHLVVLEKDGDEWWKCRNAAGAEGVVPASYLETTSVGTGKAAVPPAVDEPDDEAAELEAQREAEEATAANKRAQEQVEQQRAERERKKQEEARRVQAAAASAEVDRKRREKEKAAAEAEAARARQQEAKRSGELKESSRSSQTAKPNGSSDGKRAPPSEKVRVWHDRTGQFRVEAAFLGYRDGKLRLHKTNGVIIEVPSQKMSAEDMRYVEKVTNKKSGNSAPTRKTSEDDMPLEQRRKSLQSDAQRQPQARKAPKIDWFEFFLSAGCDVDDCTRYASSFERDKMDESILPDITDATMRSLGLREGDIIRVTKVIQQRKPKKPDTTAQDQLSQDEALARQLQDEERSGKKSSPAPNLFAGPGGALKQPQRRGRPQPSKSSPASTVDLNAINNASDNIQRTSSPQALSPASTPVQPPQRSSSALAAPATSGFDDDAWTPRPSSTKPHTPTPSAPAIRAPSAPPAPPAPAVSPPQTQPSPATLPVQNQSSGSKLVNTTESDIFDQLSRLSQLRVQSPATSPAAPSPPVNASSPPVASPPPASYQAGLGMGSSPVPMGQHVQNQQTGLVSPQNGPRGPYAPVPSNQSLLQPLIPTTTGFNNFIPTRPGNVSLQGPQPHPFMPSQVTGFPNNPQPMMSQPTAFGPTMPVLPQQTGMPAGNFGNFGASPFQNNGNFGGVQSNPTGFNPGYNQSPFANPASPPPVPPLPSSNVNANSPANIFAQMKSGTFGNDSAPQPQDKYDALRPNPLAAQATGWGNPTNGFPGAYPSYR